MDKGGYHPLSTAVSIGDGFPSPRAAVSFLSRLVLDVASPLLGAPVSGGGPKMVIRAKPAEVLTMNAYCTTCLRTRRFFDRPCHMVCETCSKRLDKVAPERGLRIHRR
jgi:hypothetical protein